MAAPKIKKKTAGARASPMPRQGAVPCLVLVVIILLVVGALIYFSLRGAG